MSFEMTFRIIYEIGIIISVILQILVIYISRKDSYIGVKIPWEKRDTKEIKDIGKGFIRENLILGILYASISFALLNLSKLGFYVYTLGSVAFCIAIGHIQNKYIEKIEKLKKENNWMQYNDKVIIDSNFYKEIKRPSMFWFIIPLGITVATVYLNYIKGISDKIFLPLAQLIITLVSIAIFIGILNAKQNINSKMPNQSKKQSIFFRKIYLYYVILRSILINILIMVIDLKLFNIITISNKLMMIIQFTILMMLYVIENILGLKYGQGGDKIKVKATEDGYITGERNDDEHWIFGNTMYYNSKDPSLWIEKRIGVGWTINAGNPIGMAIWIGSLVVLFMALTAFL